MVAAGWVIGSPSLQKEATAQRCDATSRRSHSSEVTLQGLFGQLCLLLKPLPFQLWTGIRPPVLVSLLPSGSGSWLSLGALHVEPPSRRHQMPGPHGHLISKAWPRGGASVLREAAEGPIALLQFIC